MWNNPHAILGESCIALTPRDRLCDAGVKDFLRPNTLIYLTVIASIVTALVRSCWSTGTENSSNTYIYTDIYTPVDMLNETTTTTREYSLPGVLHYLQSEWRRFERERNEWAIERAELKVYCRIKKGKGLVFRLWSTRHGLRFWRASSEAARTYDLISSNEWKCLNMLCGKRGKFLVLVATARAASSNNGNYIQKEAPGILLFHVETATRRRNWFTQPYSQVLDLFHELLRLCLLKLI